ncbi:M20 metallopeptidase family protein [Vagococcus xieshaowenii]|uniref:Amidohydrolase n=1 Tax=Vagococcus xieshaowenii TaxID=2562451 RepID=A0AAJ5EET1_9ENTE|nr:M20 family metallopeptidase [Vagococcus xieshaowenii]QCA28152.1 amidohydrolase [Vagococcus xieshaowenii]TFZ39722.1 amidohydrolase [Vagococcus xieshaowenii]
MALLDQEILKEAITLKEEMVSNRRHIHENPELGMDLPNTSLFVENKLKEMGYTDVKRVGEYGLTATVGKGDGKVFLLRADMDALPIIEDNELAYKSKIEGRMHACGHDMHTTMLLGAAKILKKYEEQIPGIIKFMFQPGEEVMKGAADMIKNGILENPRPDAGLMIHVMPGLPLDIGTVISAEAGPMMASVDWFDISIKGKGGHGSMPYTAIDPVVPMNAIQNALHTLQSRELPPNAITAITVTGIHGCETSNVIPDNVSMGGTIRSYNEEHRQLIKHRMVEISEHIAKAFRCEATVEFPAGAPYFDNSKEVADHIKKALPQYLGKMYMPPMPMDVPAMGSEDFAYISHEIPSSVMMIAASDLRKGGVYGVHHPKLVLDEECMPYGAAAYVGVALSWLEDNQ